MNRFDRWSKPKPVDHESVKWHGEIVAREFEETRLLNTEMLNALADQDEGSDFQKKHEDFLLLVGPSDTSVTRHGTLVVGAQPIETSQLAQTIYNQTTAVLVGDPMPTYDGFMRLHKGKYGDKPIYLVGTHSQYEGEDTFSLRGYNYDPSEELAMLVLPEKQ